MKKTDAGDLVGCVSGDALIKLIASLAKARYREVMGDCTAPIGLDVTYI
jgi:hypothetical protein